MASYEKTRKYVVTSIKGGIVMLAAPKGRMYETLVYGADQFSNKVAKSLKVGSKVTLHRYSDRFTTFFAPRA